MSSRDLSRGEIFLLLVEINSIWDVSILWPDEIYFSSALSLLLASVIFFVFDMFFLVFVEKVKELYDDGYISRAKVYMVLTISFVIIELSSKFVLGSILASYGLFIFQRWRIIVVLSAIKILAWIFYGKGKIENILY